MISETGTITTFGVGSYTEPDGAFRAVGEGLSLVALHPSGRLELLDSLLLPNPSFVLPLGQGRMAVVLETDDYRAGIALVRVEAGKLRHLSTIASPGRIPCHLDRHPSGRWLAGACYGTGEVFALPLEESGQLVASAMVVTRHAGSSVHPVRQTVPHPPAARFSPDGRWLVVADLGTDKVVCYPFDPARGPDFSSGRIWNAPPGSGPRLPLFSPDGRHLLLVEEIGSALACLRWEDGALRETCRVGSRIAPFAGENTAACLRWHPSGKIIGVSNRGADSIALFHYDSAEGRLAPWLELPCGGNKPRDFIFSPCGRWLIASSQNSDLLALFAVDLEAGRVTDTGTRLAVRSPSNIQALA